VDRDWRRNDHPQPKYRSVALSAKLQCVEIRLEAAGEWCEQIEAAMENIGQKSLSGQWLNHHLARHGG
jgi:hypothetical protein